MQFKAGDRVLISPNLSTFDPYETPIITSYMLKCAGKIDVVEKITPSGNVRLVYNKCNWNPKWLEPYVEIQDEVNVPDINEIL